MSSLFLLFRRLFGLDASSRLNRGFRDLLAVEDDLRDAVSAVQEEVQAANEALRAEEEALQRRRSEVSARNAMLNGRAMEAMRALRGLAEANPLVN